MDHTPPTDLAVLRIRLADVVQRGFRRSSGGAHDSLPGLAGDCYAYDYSRLVDVALEEGVAWHEWLLARTIAGLAHEKCRQPVFAGYEMLEGLVRLFLCRKQERPFRRAPQFLTDRPPFVEGGRGVGRLALIRPLAYWTPPDTAIALWPLPVDRRSGPYVVDTGNMLAFFSYPETDHATSVPVERAGSDYVRVPAQEWSAWPGSSAPGSTGGR